MPHRPQGPPAGHRAGRGVWASWREGAGVVMECRAAQPRPQGQELQFRSGCPIRGLFVSEEPGRAHPLEGQEHFAPRNAAVCAVRFVARDVLAPIAVCFQHLCRASVSTFPFRSCTLLLILFTIGLWQSVVLPSKSVPPRTLQVKFCFRFIFSEYLQTLR